MTTILLAQLALTTALQVPPPRTTGLGNSEPDQADEPSTAYVDPRSAELLKLNCASELASRETTLFGNGTLRVRIVRGAERKLHLAELDPDELEAYRQRLADETSEEPPGTQGGASGEWVEQCELTLELEPGQRRQARFSRMDSLDLGLSRLVAIADELFHETHIREATSGFPVHYSPRLGDVLVRADGKEFLIRTFTSDGKGVEVEGIEQPIVLYLPKDEVTREFVGLARNRR